MSRIDSGKFGCRLSICVLLLQLVSTTSSRTWQQVDDSVNSVIAGKQQQQESLVRLPRRGFYQRKTILSPLHSPARRLWAASRNDVNKFGFYLQFLNAYCEHKNWEFIHLVLPSKNESNDLCREFRIVLLKEAGVTADCIFRHSTASSEDFYHQLSKSSNGDPLVLCQFVGDETGIIIDVNLENLSQRGNVIVISAKDRTGPADTGGGSNADRIHYRWTSASRVNASHVQLEDIYKFATDSVPLRNQFGFWSSTHGLEIDSRREQGPTDFGGRLIRCTTIPGAPLIYTEDTTGNGTVKGHGYLIDLFDSVSQHLNFEYSLTLPADRSFGIDNHGNWSGMVGMLQRKEMDIALMSVSLTEKRVRVMDFSPPVEYSSNRLLIRKDWKNKELKWTAYTNPFHWQVWLAIPVTIALGVVTFMAFTRYKLMSATPAGSAWLLSLCFLQQGQEDHVSLRGFPCRLTLGCFWVLAVILYASYTARLTSFLAATTEKLPVNSLEEAVRTKNWKIIIVKGTAVVDRIRDSEAPAIMHMWHRIRGDPGAYVTGSEHGIRRVYKERVIFFTVDLVPSFLIKGNCSFAWVPGKYFPGFGYMGYQKDLPFAFSFTANLARLRETGQLRRIFKKWWGTEASCSEKSDNQGGFMGMSMYETGTAFLVLIVGTLLSLIFMLCEICIANYKPILKHGFIRERRFVPTELLPGSSASTVGSLSALDLPRPDFQGWNPWLTK